VQFGRLSTLLGTGEAGYSGDGGTGAEAEINNPYGLAIGPDGALYICEIDNHCIRRLDLRNQKVSTVAGNRRRGYSGDGGHALEASLDQPYEIRFDRAGNMYFVEMRNHIVRKVDARTRIISTVAGNGTPGFGGDGGPARKAQLRNPHSIAFDPAGRLLICDIGNHRIRRVDLSTGIIETWAGTGERRPTPDGAPRTGTPLNGPRAIDFDSQGNLYLALREGNAVYRLNAKTQRYELLASKLNGPKGIAWSRDGIYIADTESHTIQRIDPKTKTVTIVAGGGEAAEAENADPLKVRLARPHGVAVGRRGELYIGDSENHRVRVLRQAPSRRGRAP
jgi:DNA-binding beta-propeller fold protein YncE